MKRNDSHGQVLQYACRLLSYRGRSEKELSKRLRTKGFDEDAIDKVISDLRSNGYLDDRKLASSLRRYAEESKYLSLLGTKRLLRERGIPAAVIDEALTGFDEPETAKRLVERKLRRMKKGDQKNRQIFLGEGADDNTSKRRLEGMLLRRGFSRDIIQEVIKSFRREGEGDENC
ncbi:MAG: regulatory protein RecX [Thermodesulfovibrionales bacterium]